MGKELKREKGLCLLSITTFGLLSLVQHFKEAESFCDRSRSGAPRLSDTRTSAVALQIDTFSKQSTSGILNNWHTKDVGIPYPSTINVIFYFGFGY